MTHRDIKRRRIAPPVLDGEVRGWGMRRGVESDSEEDYEDDEPVSQGSTSWQDSSTTGEYKDANSFLHDLHALHQHRFLFASHPSNQYSCPPTTYPTGKPIMPQVSQRPPNRHKNDVSTIPEMEVERVKERYEDTNKLLGSLFLSRRRELGA